MILLCTEAYNKYQNATGGVVDSTTGLLVLTSEKYKNLKSLFFHINGVCVLSWVGQWQCGVISLPFHQIPDPFELTANAQIWPRSGNIAPFGTPGIIYLVVVDSGSKAGTGLDFVVGLRFLMRFYNAFRVSNSVYQVGLATTNLTKAVINWDNSWDLTHNQRHHAIEIYISSQSTTLYTTFFRGHFQSSEIRKWLDNLFYYGSLIFSFRNFTISMTSTEFSNILKIRQY